MARTAAYENVRDLIRRDKDRAEREAFDRLKAELAHAFAAPESEYVPLTAAEVIARNLPEAGWLRFAFRQQLRTAWTTPP